MAQTETWSTRGWSYAERKERHMVAAEEVVKFAPDGVDLVSKGVRVSGHFGNTAVVRTADPEGVDWDQLSSFVQEAIPAMDEDFQGHRTIKFTLLLRTVAGRKAVLFVKRVLQPLFVMGYRVKNVFVKQRRGNKQPWHQDKRTGTCVFKFAKECDMYAGAEPAWRILINCGPLDGKHSSSTRKMMYRQKGGKGILFESAKPIVLMNANAAGSHQESDVEHARTTDGQTGVDGLTLSLDVALTHNTANKGSVLDYLNQDDNRMSKWFHNKDEPSDAFDIKFDINQQDLLAKQKRNEAKERLLDAPVDSDETPHCWRCESRQTDRQWISGRQMKITARLCRLCGIELMLLLKRKGATLESIKFKRYSRCSNECVGCHTEPVQDMVAARAARATFAESSAVQAEEFSGDREERHCNFCSKSLPERNSFRYSDTPNHEGYIIHCHRCYVSIADWAGSGKEIPPRPAQCSDQCPGCHCAEKQKKSFIDGAIARASDALPPEQLANSRHCYFCSAPVLEERPHVVTFPKVGTVLFCYVCHTASKSAKPFRNFANKYERPGRCDAAGCTGCKAAKVGKKRKRGRN